MATAKLSIGMELKLPAAKSQKLDRIVVRLSRAVDELRRGDMSIDVSNLADVATVLEQLAMVARRARASAHNRPEEGGDVTA